MEVVSLGQAGFRFDFGSTVLYIDPYLSDSVEEACGADFRRLVPVWKPPSEIRDADYVLVTHAHGDHCDIATLEPLSRASPQCRFVGPHEVGELLAPHGIIAPRFMSAGNDWLGLSEDLRIHPVAAAHPEIETDAMGNSRCIGYVLEYRGKVIYHSGDTSLNREVIAAVSPFAPLNVAILPVNERNYCRGNLGIIGNMSIRDAFFFAEQLRAETMVAMHWDLFALNEAYPEEIAAVSARYQPPFRVLLNPTEV